MIIDYRVLFFSDLIAKESEVCEQVQKLMGPLQMSLMQPTGFTLYYSSLFFFHEHFSYAFDI